MWHLYGINASSADGESDNTTWATQYEVLFWKHVYVSAADTTSDGFTSAEQLINSNSNQINYQDQRLLTIPLWCVYT